MKEWRPVDWIAFVVTVCICIPLATGLIVGRLCDLPMTEAQANRIDGIVNALIALLSAYVGYSFGKRPDKKPPKDKEE